MPNFAAALREEVIRLARKELRTETAGLKKAVGRYRSEIATLKKRLSAVEQQLSRRRKENSRNQGRNLAQKAAELPHCGSFGGSERGQMASGVALLPPRADKPSWIGITRPAANYRAYRRSSRPGWGPPRTAKPVPAARRPHRARRQGYGPD